MRIVMLADTLTTGGAETFLLRMAKALQTRGHEVRVAALRGDRLEPGLIDSIASGIPVDAFRFWGMRSLMPVDGLLQSLGIDFSMLRWLQRRWLARLIERHGVQVLHSHLMISDLVASIACKTAGIPWLSTMHGDYLTYEPNGHDRAARIANFTRAVRTVERHVGVVVCITEIQQAQMRRLMPSLAVRGGLHKIYNGYPARPATDSAQHSVPKAISHIPPDALVVGMVSRGLREKGWDVLVDAARRLDKENVWLVLVGEGPRLAELRASIQDPRVVFVGNVTNPLDYIKRFDIACLPSRYTSESLPTVVIEYLQQEKPVVATGIGEIPTMLRAGSKQAAGITIAFDTEEAMAAELADVLRLLADDTALRTRLSQAAPEAFEPFDMEVCLQRYEALYAELETSA